MESQNSLTTVERIIDVTNSIQTAPFDELRQKLILLINELINKDFHSLIQLLYRIDVSEKKIRTFLDEDTERDSATILAALIIERQLEKAESRQRFSNKNNPKSDEEKW
ncbi:MAG TPA: hypothetical protein VIJ75_02815 [Hanamia sp.]